MSTGIFKHKSDSFRSPVSQKSQMEVQEAQELK